MTLAIIDIAAAIESQTAPPPGFISGWSVDTRTIEAGDLFFALRGPNHDGHDFVSRAFEKGAGAAVVDRPLDAGGTLLPVADCREALARLAGWARDRWAGTVVAITGSAGKTTTKDTIAHLLESRMSVGKTVGNYNNHIGVPLSILRLPDASQIAVLEIGMNHTGEIRQLAGIAKPLIGVVTNAGYAHMENFDSLDGVAAAKRELIESLPPDGTAVLNADDARVAGFRQIHRGAVLTFGFSEEADVSACEIERLDGRTRFRLQGAGWYETPIEGRHGVRNILAALAVTQALGFAPEDFIEAVRTLETGAMRGNRFTHAGITIFNDCYNSNPEAVSAMLETLAETPAGRRIAVLGEMLELGRWAETLHRQVGRTVAERGVDVLVGIRGAARHMVDAAVVAGLPASAAYFFEDPITAGDHLRELARPGDAILFKGSRGTRAEQALERFLK